MGKFVSGAKITAVHGQMRKVNDRFVIPMFHPAAALHQAALKPSILADFANLPDQLNEARAALGKPPIIQKKQETLEQDKPKQLNLF
jgi:DNA polymerase